MKPPDQRRRRDQSGEVRLPPSLPASHSSTVLHSQVPVAPSMRDQLSVLVMTPEWSAVLRAINAALSKAPARWREDFRSDVLLALVENAERGEKVKSWAGLAMVIANRIILKARQRDRLELRELDDRVARCRLSFDEVTGGACSAVVRHIRGGVQAAVIRGILAGESCESIAARIARPLYQVRQAMRNIQRRIEKLKKTKRFFIRRGTL